MKVSEKLNMIAALPNARIAFDGCHKIYVCTDAAGVNEAVSCGYDQGDLYPATDIHYLWGKTCGLRFVSSITLADAPWTIGQGEDDDTEDES